MNIALASDLHFEYHERRIHQLIDHIAADTDVLVLAGDIQTHDRIILDLLFIHQALPDIHIVYVAGNHEFYGSTLSSVTQSLQVAFEDHPKIHYLEKSTFELEGVVFLGTTLWTGFNAYPEYPQSLSEEKAMHGVADFMRISHGMGRFQAHHCKALFTENCAWLSNTLASVNNTHKTAIVVTHFPPLPELAHGMIPTNVLSNYFQADCRDIIETYQPAYWLYGHNHWSDMQKVGNTTLMSNQLGYPSEYCNTDTLLTSIMFTD